MMIYVKVTLLMVLGLVSTSIAADDDSSKDLLIRMACAKKPDLAFCQPKPKLELITPPPLPPSQTKKRRLDIPERSNDDRSKTDSTKVQRVKLSPEELSELRSKCTKISPIANANCQPQRTKKENLGRCEAYMRDCGQFMAKSDPLYDISQVFSSGVNINLATVEVSGIPYYPINEEGGVGVAHTIGIPFGSWGGGFTRHVGVRDYFSGTEEVGANWVEGKYGYKNGWSIPLVQSLGIEGGQHNTASIPLTGPNALKLDVDNGYNVGGYYGHNDHVGVDWKRGNVQHTFGVGSPFVGAGFNTGQAVAFPGADVWANALG